MKVELSVESDRIGMFYELLATGFFVKAPSGISVRNFLIKVLRLDPVYVDTRIQTIFLNGRAIDDIDVATLEDGSVLALSGAMPGLAGAVFRRGGAYAAMRSCVESVSSSLPKTYSDGNIELKLFNQIAADLGNSFLKKGIWLRVKTFSRFFYQHFETLLKICAIMVINGKKYPANKLDEMKFDSDEVDLTVVPI
jgi:hypothetical protein